MNTTTITRRYTPFYAFFLLINNPFTFNGHRCLQLRDIPMGGTYNGYFANLFMAIWEKKASAFCVTPSTVPIQRRHFWHLETWRSGQYDFHRFLKGLDAHITINLHYSYESLRFLDLELYRAGTNIGRRIGFPGQPLQNPTPSSGSLLTLF